MKARWFPGRSGGRPAFAMVTVVAAVACGPGVPAQPPAPFDGDLDSVLTITVTNEQLEEARVWLIVSGQRQTLGAVRSNQTVTFHHPMDQIRSVRMEFDVTLGQRCVTTDRSLGPGDEITARIPVNLIAFQGVCRGR